MSDVYSYSTDLEIYRGECATREGALIEGADGQTGITVWTGKCVPVNIRSYLPTATDIIERMAESAYDDSGEVAEGWLDDVLTTQAKELEADIQAVIMAWIDKHKLHANFWNVEDVIKHDIPAESLSVTKETGMEHVVQPNAKATTAEKFRE